ncbi:MAG: DNA internalization-related competence protein ComEC/Rec2, partial [Gammaproteobacteria bacterium]
IDYWRMRLADAIESSCADCAQRGLIKALSLGYRGDIADRERNLLRDSGTAHLLAISGMHIGLVSMLAFAFGRLCWRCGWLSQRLNRMQVAALFAMLAALVYAALAGFSLPTVRALVMLAVLLAALQLRQRVNLLQSLSLALVAILLADPRSVGSSSFWLSAGALLVIAFAQFRLPSTLRWWQQLLLLQIFFSLLFAPVGALVFNQFNPASLPANLVAIPLISFIVLPSVLLACLLSGMVPVISGALFRLADRLLQLLLDYLEWLLSAGLEPVVSAYPFALLLLALVLIGLLMLPCGPGLRMAALTGLCLLPLWQPQRPAPGEFELFVLDVGMGTSILVQTRHHSLVYDFGPGRAGVYSAAEWALVPLVRARGIKQPDLVIVSHADQDHSGGLHALVE